MRASGIEGPGPLTPRTKAAANALVVAIAERADKAAFITLFEHFSPRVKNFLMQRGEPAAVAEEITQETMLTMWRKAGSFSPERGDAVTWIFTIARNLAIDGQRRDRTQRAEAPDPAGAEDTPPSAEVLMIASEREERVRSALAILSPEQADIVNLSFFQDRPHAEIAHRLGIPLGTVKSRIRLAVARLRAVLDDLP